MNDGLLGKLGLSSIKSGLSNLYHDFKNDKKSFKNVVTRLALDSRITDPSTGEQLSLEEFARNHNVTDKMNTYLASEFSGWQHYLRRGLDIVTSVKDTLEDVVEGAEAVAEVAAAPETAGAGSIAVEIGGNAVEVPLYLASQTIYSIVSLLIGFSSGVYGISGKGALDYLWDTTKGFAGSLANTLPVFDAAAELLTNPDDKRPRIAYGIADRVAYKLFVDLGFEAKKPRTLETVLSDLKDRIRPGKEKEPQLELYKGDPVYGSDLFPKLQPETVRAEYNVRAY